MEPRLKYLDSQISGVYQNPTNRTRKILNKQKINLMVLLRITNTFKNWEILILSWLLLHFFIMMMFITLEISPVLVKLISSVGPYDYLLDKT